MIAFCGPFAGPEWISIPEKTSDSELCLRDIFDDCIRSLADEIEKNLQKSGWNGSLQNRQEQLKPYEYRSLIGCLYQVRVNLNDINLLLTISLPRKARPASLIAFSYST